MTVSRRAFLQSASASFGAALLDHVPFAVPPSDLEKTFQELRANLLAMVNEEREVAKVPPVEIDELATRVATKHAVDMATVKYASHWGRDGLKPYHRYSFAGGTDATQENVSSADNTWSTKLKDLMQDTSYLHVRLYQEKPPYDGHRRAILAPQHTHVGLGLAVDQLRLRLVELFVARHVEVDPVRREGKPGGGFKFVGNIVRQDHVLNSVEVFYEPLPQPPELSWLQQARSYALPDESRMLWPKLLPPLVYADKTKGVVDISTTGLFRAPVKFYKKEPGIYTIVAWIRHKKAEKAFPATEVCIRVE